MFDLSYFEMDSIMRFRLPYTSFLTHLFTITLLCLFIIQLLTPADAVGQNVYGTNTGDSNCTLNSDGYGSWTDGDCWTLSTDDGNVTNDQPYPNGPDDNAKINTEDFILLTSSNV